MAIILELLPSLGDSERLVAATCNEQPVISLVSDNEVPCSPVRVADVVNVTQNSALVSWTYSNRTEIDQFECVFDFNGFPGSYFRTALDQIIELNSSTILPAEARETVENCEAVLLSGEANVVAWAFQIILTNSRTAEVSERCIFVGDSAIDRQIISGRLDTFNIALEVQPGESYSVKVRPIVLSFETDKLVVYKFGPLSNERAIVAEDAAPSGPVRDTRVQSREDDRLNLQWSQPLTPNGRIVRYVLIMSGGSTNLVTNETVDVFTSGESSVSFTLTDLDASAVYDITIFAETSRGRGPPAARTFATCPKNMRTLKNDPTNCVAKRGFFLTKGANGAIACSSLGNFVELADCLEDNLKVQDLRLARGFWRPSLDSIDIRRCPLGSNACRGGQNLSLCQPNYEGPMCAVCSEGFFSNDVECDKCTEPNWTRTAPWVYVGVTILGFLLCGGVYFAINSKNDNILGGTMALKFKVLLSTYQIVGTFTWTLGTAFPNTYAAIVEVFQFLSFDITDVIPLECIYRSNFLVELCIVTVSPIALLFVILVIWGYARSRAPAGKAKQAEDILVEQVEDTVVEQEEDNEVEQAEDTLVEQEEDSEVGQAEDTLVEQAEDILVEQEEDDEVEQGENSTVEQAEGTGRTKDDIDTAALQACIILSFVAYTPAVSKIFRGLRYCDEFKDIGQSFMPEDYTISCGSREHEKVMAVIRLMGTVYIAGTLVFYLVILKYYWKNINRQLELLALESNNADGRLSVAQNKDQMVQDNHDEAHTAPTNEDLYDIGINRNPTEEQKLDKKLRGVSFLYRSYRYPWWEFVEVARKTVLGGAIVMVPGSFEQSVTLMLLALFSTLLYHHFLPFREHNLLGLIASYSIFFAAFASLLVKVRADLLDSPVLDGLLVLVVLSPLLCALILTNWKETYDFFKEEGCSCRKERKFRLSHYI